MVREGYTLYYDEPIQKIKNCIKPKIGKGFFFKEKQ